LIKEFDLCYLSSSFY